MMRRVQWLNDLAQSSTAVPKGGVRNISIPSCSLHVMCSDVDYIGPSGLCKDDTAQIETRHVQISPVVHRNIM